EWSTCSEIRWSIGTGISKDQRLELNRDEFWHMALTLRSVGLITSPRLTFIILRIRIALP
ncbi:MAG: hypothetical protein ABI851_16265, partial [Saprospiraceae bacterium]